MLKKIISFALVLSMLIPISVSAQSLTVKPVAQAVTNQTNSIRAPYASQIKSERQIIKANYNTNQVIRDAIKVKLAKVKTIIAQDKANKTLI